MCMKVCVCACLLSINMCIFSNTIAYHTQQRTKKSRLQLWSTTSRVLAIHVLCLSSSFFRSASSHFVSSRIIHRVSVLVAILTNEKWLVHFVDTTSHTRSKRNEKLIRDVTDEPSILHMYSLLLLLLSSSSSSSSTLLLLFLSYFFCLFMRTNFFLIVISSNAKTRCVSACVWRRMGDCVCVENVRRHIQLERNWFADVIRETSNDNNDACLCMCVCLG